MKSVEMIVCSASYLNLLKTRAIIYSSFYSLSLCCWLQLRAQSLVLTTHRGTAVAFKPLHGVSKRYFW